MYKLIREWYLRGLISRDGAGRLFVEMGNNPGFFATQEEEDIFEEALSWYGGDAIFLMLDLGAEGTRDEVRKTAQEAHEYWESLEWMPVGAEDFSAPRR